MSIFTAYLRVLLVGMLITSLYKAQLKIFDSSSKIYFRRVCCERSEALPLIKPDECVYWNVLVGFKCVLGSSTDVFLSLDELCF